MSPFLLYYSNSMLHIKNPSSPVNMAFWTASWVTNCNIAHGKFSLKKTPNKPHRASAFTVWFYLQDWISHYRAMHQRRRANNRHAWACQRCTRNRQFPSICGTVQMSEVEVAHKAIRGTSHVSDHLQKKLHIKLVSPALHNAKVNTKSINSTCHKPRHTTA